QTRNRPESSASKDIGGAGGRTKVTTSPVAGLYDEMFVWSQNAMVPKRPRPAGSVPVTTSSIRSSLVARINVLPAHATPTACAPGEPLSTTTRPSQLTYAKRLSTDNAGSSPGTGVAPVPCTATLRPHG